MGLAAIVNVQRLAGECDLASIGHMQQDPRQDPAYRRLVEELVDLGVLPTDDIFAPASRAEDEVARSGPGPAVLEKPDS